MAKNLERQKRCKEKSNSNMHEKCTKEGAKKWEASEKLNELSPHLIHGSCHVEVQAGEGGEGFHHALVLKNPV